MDGFLGEWLNLLLRWGHMIAGIAWIGTSFYFVALDFSLKKPAGLPAGVGGEAWEVHGGGFYHVQKYLSAPARLPSHLIWFKWEAYLTWVTGFLLLVVQYYFQASAYLIDPAVMALAPWQAIAISAVSIVAGWAVYDALCRSPLGRNTTALAACVFALVLGSAFLFTHVFSGRGAFIQTGVVVGTIMAANVFMVIIPNQRKITAALIRGETPDPRLGAIGKQRSLHNTYLTLPVLLHDDQQPLRHADGCAQCLAAAGPRLRRRRGAAALPGAPRSGRSLGQDRLDPSGHLRGAGPCLVSVACAAPVARLGQSAHPLGPHDRGHRLDRHLLLFRRAGLLAAQARRAAEGRRPARPGRSMAAASITCASI